MGGHTSDAGEETGDRPRGTVEAIHISLDAKPAPMQSVEEVEAVAGRGLNGDRYFRETGTFNRRDDLEPASDVTLIEAEAIEACKRDHGIEIPPGGTRRNITTREVPLNHLVDREFQIGTATCRGIALCEPCGPIEEYIGESGVVQALMHRGGLDARIVKSGQIQVGDAIRY